MGLIIEASHELALNYSSSPTSHIQIIGTLGKGPWHFTDVLVHCLKWVKTPISCSAPMTKEQDTASDNTKPLTSNAQPGDNGTTIAASSTRKEITQQLHNVTTFYSFFKFIELWVLYFELSLQTNKVTMRSNFSWHKHIIGCNTGYYYKCTLQIYLCVHQTNDCSV